MSPRIRQQQPQYEGLTAYVCGSKRVQRWHVLLAALLVVGSLLLMPWIAPWFYWDVNPATQWVPPPPDGINLNLTDQFNLLAPKIIHHRWNDQNVPERWASVRQRCMDMHPDYTFMLWTEEKERKMLQDHFPWFLKTYDSYKYTIQQADVTRYFFLYHFGGLYLDLDVECLKRVDYLLTYPVSLPLTWPVGFSNDVLVSPPGHAFYKQVTEAASRWNKRYGTKYPTVMFSTGPMFLTYQAMLYPDRDGLWGLPRSLYGKWTHSNIAFFDHYHASMWHAQDAAIFIFFWNLRWPLLLVAMFGSFYTWHRRRASPGGSPRVRDFDLEGQAKAA